LIAFTLAFNSAYNKTFHQVQNGNNSHGVMPSEHFLLAIKPVDEVRCEGVNLIMVAALFQFIHWTAARRQYQSGVSDPGRFYPGVLSKEVFLSRRATLRKEDLI
jgi:hypothetical protein